MVQVLKKLPAMLETQVQSLGGEVPLEKGMATHSSILAWRILWMRSLVGYNPWGCKESDATEQGTLSLLHTAACPPPLWSEGLHLTCDLVPLHAPPRHSQALSPPRWWLNTSPEPTSFSIL